MTPRTYQSLIGGLLFAVLLGVFINIQTRHAPILTPPLPVEHPTTTLKSSSVTKQISVARNPNCVSEGIDDVDCYQAYYTDMVHRLGVKAAFDDMKERYTKSKIVESQCHQLTHAVGRAAVGAAGDPGEAFAEGDAFCWSGYYHGVMEEVLANVGKEQLAEKINHVCEHIEGKDTYAFNYYNCVHGLGHGVMQLYNTDLFLSLDACSILTGSWEQNSCAGGVFMENIMIESRGGVSGFLKKDDPAYPCDAVSESYKGACYLMQTSHMLVAANSDFAKVFAMCGNVEGAYRATCFQSLGRDASGRSVSNAVQTKKTCMLGADQFAQENCVIGAVKDFISYFHSDTQAKDFCASLPSPLRETCSTTATTYYATF